MVAHTGSVQSVQSANKAPALGPLAALAFLGFSLWLMSRSDNTFLLLLPVGIAVLSARNKRANKWYWLPLAACAAMVLWLLLMMASMWVASR